MARVHTTKDAVVLRRHLNSIVRLKVYVEIYVWEFHYVYLSYTLYIKIPLMGVFDTIIRHCRGGAEVVPFHLILDYNRKRYQNNKMFFWTQFT